MTRLPDLAIVGADCLFPGAHGLTAYRDLLWAGRDGCTATTPRTYGVDPAHVQDLPEHLPLLPHGLVGKVPRHADDLLLPHDMVQGLDPLHAWCLHVGRGALADAGLAPGDPRLVRCGLALGVLCLAGEQSTRLLHPLYEALVRPIITRTGRLSQGPDHFFPEAPHPVTGLDLQPVTAAACLSAAGLGLQGPRLGFEAACASSLYALHLAACWLADGRADMVLAGAAAKPDPLSVVNGFHILHALPGPHGASMPFDRRSAGIKLGEGCGMVLLMRPETARAMGLRIRAHVCSVGLSNDGGGSHLLTPGMQGQLTAYRRAYAGGEAPVHYIESHGTGTPLGDQVELDGLEAFLDGGAAPLLGGNKANLGHMLPAAGMASLLKVLLAMEARELPPTAPIEQPLRGRRGLLDTSTFVHAVTPWPDGPGPCRAGINAFGFGGCNAHAVLRGPEPAPRIAVPEPARPPEPPPIPLVVIGMDGHFGPMAGNAALAQAFAGHGPAPAPSSHHDLEGLLPDYAPPVDGWFLEEATFDCTRLRLPPREVNIYLAGQLLVATAADTALRMAGFVPGKTRRPVGVVVAYDLDPAVHRSSARLRIAHQLETHRADTPHDDPVKWRKFKGLVTDTVFPPPSLEGVSGGVGNLIAARVSSIWGFDGPSFTVSEGNNSVAAALAVARDLLIHEDLEAVVVGAVDQAGQWERQLWERMRRPASRGGTRFGFNAGCEGWTPGEGAGVLVLTTPDRVGDRRELGRILAESRAGSYSGVGEVPRTEPGHVYAAARACLARAGIAPSDVAFIEASASGMPEEDLTELEGLALTYGNVEGKQGPYVASAKAVVGHTFTASGMAALQAVLHAFARREVPRVPDWQGARYPAFEPAGFRTASEPVPLGDDAVAAVSCLGPGAAHHIVLRAGAAVADWPKSEPSPRGSVLKTLHFGPKRYGDFNLAALWRDYHAVTPAAVPAVPSPVPAPHAAPAPTLPTPATTPTPGAPIPATGAARIAAMRRQALAHVHEAMDAYLRAVAGFHAGGPVPAAAPAPTPPAPAPARPLPSPAPPASAPPAAPAPLPAAVPLPWARDTLEQLVAGRPSEVLGPAYAALDDRPHMRPPRSAFLFVTRLTRLGAERGSLAPFTMAWDYDIPIASALVADIRAPALLMLESTHALIFGLMVIGGDVFHHPGARFRLLEARTRIEGALPQPGDTLTFTLDVRFVPMPRAVLVHYTARGSVGDRHVLESASMGGVFLAEDLAGMQGIRLHLPTPDSPGPSLSFADCPRMSTATTFDREAILAVQAGDFQACFGGHPIGLQYALAPPALLLLHRIDAIEAEGGLWGRGLIVGAWDIEPDHWLFAAHFPDDPLMPGTAMVEGCGQTLLFLMIYLGLLPRDAVVEPNVAGDESHIRFCKEVLPQPGTLTYHLHVRTLHRDPVPTLTYLAEIRLNGTIIALLEHMTLRLIPPT